MGLLDITISAILIQLVASMYKVSDFKGGPLKVMPKNGIYQVDVGLESYSDVNGDIPFAYADLNGDQYTDMVTVSQDFHRVSIYLWQQDQNQFVRAPQVISINKIVSVQIGDFNYDGKIDLLISNQIFAEYQFQIMLQHGNFQFGLQGGKPDALLVGNMEAVTLLDIDGDLKTDIVYMDRNSNLRLVSTLQADEKSFKTQNFDNFISKNPNCLNYLKVVLNTGHQYFQKPNSNQVADLNNDCKAGIFTLLGIDLFIVSTNQIDQQSSTELYHKLDDGLYCLIDFQRYDHHILSVGVADIDFDGGIDILMAYQLQGQEPAINIYYNHEPAKANALCEYSLERTFANHFDNFDTYNNGKKLQVLKMEDQIISSKNLLFSQYTSNTPFILRIGDFNADGYPEILVSLQQSKIQTTYLLSNDEGNDGLRSFGLNNQYQLISSIQSGYGSFIDIAENGVLDIMLVQYDSVKKQSHISSFYNYLNFDTFFLKATATNGFQEDVYGAFMIGAYFQFVITDLNGNPKVANVGQVTATQNAAMQLPYAYFGLGRTNNYVEDFTCGIPLKGMNYFKMWTPIIPNSQLIVFPTQDDTDKWAIKIFLNPTKAIMIIVLTIVVILICLGLIIIYLHRKEKAEDRQNQDEYFWVFG